MIYKSTLLYDKALTSLPQAVCASCAECLLVSKEVQRGGSINHIDQ